MVVPNDVTTVGFDRPPQGGISQGDMMADDVPELKKEVARLRRDLDRVVQMQKGQATRYLNDAEGRPRGVFQVDEEGAHLEIWNKKGQVVVSIGETKDGAGEIYVAGADGKPRAGLKVTTAGGVVSAQNPEGRIGALMIGKADGGTIVVADADGRPLVEIGTVVGRGKLAIKQPSGSPVVVLTGDGNGGVLDIFDGEGRRPTSSGFLP